MALSATAAGVTAAVLFGTLAPLHSTWMPSGGSGTPGAMMSLSRLVASPSRPVA